MNKAALILALILLVFSLASAASQEPRHPLSHIHPTDTDFNMSGYQVFNASSFELQDGLNFSSYTVYDQGNLKLLEYDSSNSEWDILNTDLNLNGNTVKNPGLLSMQGNIDMNGFNITEIDTLHFETGMKINGSINTSGGNVDLDNGSINDVYSIDGGGDAIRFDDVIDMNSNTVRELNNLKFGGGRAYIVQDTDGENIVIQADDTTGTRTDYLVVDPNNTKVKLPNPALDMAGNNIINPGLTDGADLDNPGNGLDIKNSRYIVIQNAIGNNELNNSQRFTVEGLNLTDTINMTGNRITNIPAPQDGGDAVNKSYVDRNDDTIKDNQTLAEVLDQGNSAADDNIDLSSQDIYSVRRLQFADRNSDATNYNITETGGNLQVQKDGSQRITVMKGGNVKVPNGNLNVSGGQVTVPNNDVIVGDNRIVVGRNSPNPGLNFEEYGVLKAKIRRADSGTALKITNPTGYTRTLSIQGGNVEIPNGNLDVGGNNITSIDTLKFVEGTSINGDLELNGTINATGDLNMENGNINDVQSIDGGGNAVRFDDRIDIHGERVEDSTGKLSLGDGTVEVPNGAIEVQGNVETASGTVSSTNKMCIGDQCS